MYFELILEKDHENILKIISKKRLIDALENSA